MSDTIGSLIDKLCTASHKMYDAQSELYVVRKMSFEEFKEQFGADDDKLKVLYDYFHRATNLNLQRQAMILEVDKKIVELVVASTKGDNLDNGVFIQDQHKTY